jgi:hypothetical protein
MLVFATPPEGMGFISCGLIMRNPCPKVLDRFGFHSEDPFSETVQLAWRENFNGQGRDDMLPDASIGSSGQDQVESASSTSISRKRLRRENRGLSG